MCIYKYVYNKYIYIYICDKLKKYITLYIKHIKMNMII